MEVARERHLRRIDLLLNEFPVVTLLGARQVGKSTLARQLVASRSDPTAWFDLENPVDLTRLADPGLELRPLQGLVVLDEIQRLPEVFPLLRVLADRPGTPARFLVLGSASPDLLRQTSETLAGRVAFHELDGFGLNEVNEPERLWLRGGFPRSYLAPSAAASRRWRDGFIQTFLARDVPELGSLVSPTTLHRFWTMLAHSQGTLLNAAQIAAGLGVSGQTVGRYLDLLVDLLLVRRLPPDARDRVWAGLYDGPRADLRAIAARMREAVPVVRRNANRVYDRYLRANRVDAGIASYGLVVDLLLGTDGTATWRELAGAMDAQGAAHPPTLRR